jgi:hypothetical protein
MKYFDLGYSLYAIPICIMPNLSNTRLTTYTNDRTMVDNPDSEMAVIIEYDDYIETMTDGQPSLLFCTFPLFGYANL